MTRKLRWGIISTGSIAGTLARALATSKTSELVAVASRSADAAARFAAEHAVARAYASYEQLLADPEVEVVYIATPHPSHAQWAIAAARAKKHILCEKPLAMNEREVRAVVQAARENDVFLMEAFMYRCHPQTRELVSLIQRGVLGQVKAVHACFGFSGAFSATGRLLNNELGGGGILDVGCYPVSLARLVAGAANGQPFCEPLEVHALGHLGPSTRVDEYAVAICKFPGEILATLATSVQLEQDNVVRIFGTEARVLLRQPWLPAPDGGFSEILIERRNREPETLRVSAHQSPYAYEVDTVAAQIAQREAREMTLADSLGNAQALDRWRQGIGLTYPADLPQG
ncbi:MAG: Gfo/Idh/MocA family oxidoreductase [Pseudomonadota bacterium]